MGAPANPPHPKLIVGLFGFDAKNQRETVFIGSISYQLTGDDKESNVGYLLRTNDTAS